MDFFNKTKNLEELPRISCHRSHAGVKRFNRPLNLKRFERRKLRPLCLAIPHRAYCIVTRNPTEPLNLFFFYPRFSGFHLGTLP
eukprot:6136013-Amphidinium_carterae.1